MGIEFQYFLLDSSTGRCPLSMMDLTMPLMKQLYLNSNLPDVEKQVCLFGMTDIIDVLNSCYTTVITIIPMTATQDQ